MNKIYIINLRHLFVVSILLDLYFRPGINERMIPVSVQMSHCHVIYAFCNKYDFWSSTDLSEVVNENLVPVKFHTLDVIDTFCPYLSCT